MTTDTESNVKEIGEQIFAKLRKIRATVNKYAEWVKGPQNTCPTCDRPLNEKRPA